MQALPHEQVTLRLVLDCECDENTFLCSVIATPLRLMGICSRYVL